MLYYLFIWLHKEFNIPGAGVFQYISFRTSMAVILSLFVTTVYGSRLIKVLTHKQVGESVRNLGLEGQMLKQGTPTMGGIIILLGILIPTLLFARIDNIYVILMLITTVWMGVIGFIDDYIKVFKKDKQGLAGRFKIMGQVGLALIIGWTMYFHPAIVVREQVSPHVQNGIRIETRQRGTQTYFTQDLKSTKTNIPFYKNNEFDYSKVLRFTGGDYQKYTLPVFLLFIVLIVTAVSNGANLTDGIDGLAKGTSAIIGNTLVVFA
jgi:phospho-N-acetylmuramoyl-pentapeptide-transferase